MKSKPDAQRVWLLVGAMLFALFLLRTAGMVFEGALTGAGMFVALTVAFSTFPAIKRILYSMGGLTDLVVSFGLPYLLASVMGVNGGTMMIGSMTCGLLLTFSLKTRQLGGPFSAVAGSTKLLLTDSMSSFEAWRKDLDERRNQVGNRGTDLSDRNRVRDQCAQNEEETGHDEEDRRRADGRLRPRRLATIEADYSVK